jgi:hypothetical protein
MRFDLGAAAAPVQAAGLAIRRADGLTRSGETGPPTTDLLPRPDGVAGVSQNGDPSLARDR